MAYVSKTFVPGEDATAADMNQLQLDVDTHGADAGGKRHSSGQADAIMSPVHLDAIPATLTGKDADTVDGAHKGTGSADVIVGATADSKISTHNSLSTAHSSLPLFAERVVMLDRGTIDFSGAATIAWTDVNCSTIVSATAKKVILVLEASCNTEPTASIFIATIDVQVRKNGGTSSQGGIMSRYRVDFNGDSGAAASRNQVICELDANKIFEYAVTCYGLGSFSYLGRIVGYIETLA